MNLLFWVGLLLMFQVSVLVALWPLKIAPLCCPERSVTNQTALCDNPEDWRSKLHSSKSLKFLNFFLQVVKNTLNPVWQKFSVPVRTLCNGDYHRNMKVACFDWNSNGKHSLIGEFFITLHQLSEGHSGFQCVHPEKLVCICCHDKFLKVSVVRFSTG